MEIPSVGVSAVYNTMYVATSFFIGCVCVWRGEVGHIYCYFHKLYVRILENLKPFIIHNSV